MEGLLYWLARGLIAGVQALPLRWVARLGRLGGALAYRLDARHRRVTRRNLTRCFGAEKSPSEIQALTQETFRRIGENFACAAKTAAMSAEQLRPHVEFGGAERAERFRQSPTRNVVIAIGHFGNFELFARMGAYAPNHRLATTYRRLRQPRLNALLQQLRHRSGALFFERLSEGWKLKTALRQNDLLLGLLADQHAGKAGYRLPFLGHDCSTSLAPAVFALRYDAPLYTAICYRVGLARWRIELNEEIPTHAQGRPRSPLDLMRDVHRDFEAAVRRDPANWFWVHDRWKTVGREPKTSHRSTPDVATFDADEG